MTINWKKPGKEIEEILKLEFNFVRGRKGWNINIVGIEIELPKEMVITFIKYVVKNIKYFVYKYKDKFPEKFKILYAQEIKEQQIKIAEANAAKKNSFPGMPPGWTPGKPLPQNWRPSPNMNIPQGWRPGLQLPPGWNPVPTDVKSVMVGGKEIEIDISAPPPPPPPRIILSPQTNKPVLVMDDDE